MSVQFWWALYSVFFLFLTLGLSLVCSLGDGDRERGFSLSTFRPAICRLRQA